jgi:hypothetical protein
MNEKVLLTGISGWIAKHAALEYSVAIAKS